MIAMMGFFAVYAGFVYNDMFALGLNLFGSRYYFAGQDAGAVEEGTIAYPIADYGDAATVYPFGLDPIWHVSSIFLDHVITLRAKMPVLLKRVLLPIQLQIMVMQQLCIRSDLIPFGMYPRTNYFSSTPSK